MKRLRKTNKTSKNTVFAFLNCDAACKNTLGGYSCGGPGDYIASYNSQLAKSKSKYIFR